MKLTNLFKYFTCAITLLMASSCSNGFLDVNEDPTRSTKSSPDIVLPAAMGSMAYAIGNHYTILGGFWAQYWTQGPTSSQYNGLDQYQITATTFERGWGDLYNGSLRDLKYVIDNSLVTYKDSVKFTADQRSLAGNYAGIAKILQAYGFQVMTDIYGDVPFTEALKGEVSEGGISNPVFDSQDKIYDGIIKLIEEGKSYIDSHGRAPSKDDLIYGGDMEKWLLFANTLELKVFLRQSEIRPAIAKAGIEDLFENAEGFVGDVASSQGEMQFFDATFNKNPLNATFATLGTGNIIASNTVLNYLTTTADPRIDIFYKKATTGSKSGQYSGLKQGEGKSATFPATVADTDFSKPGDAVAGPKAPVVFISTAESIFLQAEAIARGWTSYDPGDAEDAYDAAIKASFDKWAITAAKYNTYMLQPSVQYGSATNKIKAIITQKWVAMSGNQNLEAWTEWRRTGYPDFLTLSLDRQVGDIFPARLLYPSSETTRNSHVPPQKTVGDKVWWDVN